MRGVATNSTGSSHSVSAASRYSLAARLCASPWNSSHSGVITGLARTASCPRGTGPSSARTSAGPGSVSAALHSCLTILIWFTVLRVSTTTTIRVESVTKVAAVVDNLLGSRAATWRGSPRWPAAPAAFRL